MAKWHITASGGAPAKRLQVQWKLVSFRGPKGGESRGIVDIVAIRKNHKVDDGRIRRGDLFEIVLIQVKGGGAGKPTDADAARLRAVKRRHGAKAVLYVHWRRGAATTWYKLNRVDAKQRWTATDKWAEVFR